MKNTEDNRLESTLASENDEAKSNEHNAEPSTTLVATTTVSQKTSQCGNGENTTAEPQLNLNLDDKRKEAEDRLAKISQTQQDCVNSALQQARSVAISPEATASMPATKTAEGDPKIDNSVNVPQEAVKENSLNALLMGEHLLSPLEGLEKIKKSHHLQMDKLIAGIEAVMTQETTASKVIKANE